MKTLIISVKIFLFFTLLTGIIYPLLVTGVAQLVLPAKANGSMIMIKNKIVGSDLIGQRFDSSFYFTGRPSAVAYNPLPSGGSNLGLTSLKLKHSVDSLKVQFVAFNQVDNNAEIPSEMLFASASGLDPHISPQAALLQVGRISRVRNLTSAQKSQLETYINSSTQNPQFGLLGEPCVNVLILNLELDHMFNKNLQNN